MDYTPSRRPTFKEIVASCREMLEELELRQQERQESQDGGDGSSDDTLRTKKALEIMKNRHTPVTPSTYQCAWLTTALYPG